MCRALTLLVSVSLLHAISAGDSAYFTGPSVRPNTERFPWRSTAAAVSMGLELNGRGDHDLAVVCVTQEGVASNISSGLGCPTGKNFAEAQAICEQSGHRLPLKDEVIRCKMPLRMRNKLATESHPSAMAGGEGFSGQRRVR